MKIKNTMIWNKNYFKQRIRRQISKYIFKPYSKLIYSRKYNYLADPNKILYIDTDDITGWYGGNKYSEFAYVGQIKGGDWSRRITSRDQVLRESGKYKGIVQHFIDGLPWRETDLFKINYSNLLASGIKVKGFDNITGLENYYRETYDSLYENIKKKGILTDSFNGKNIDPMYIIINADGQILYTVGGNHRLFMCIILGIKKIGVKVRMRHEDWQNKRELILSGSWRKSNNFDVELLNHPDIISDQGMSMDK